MNQKKSKKIVGCLIILLIFIIIISGGLFAYFTTDIFKSNKESFFKYIIQLGDTEDGFIENNIKQYYEKKNTNSYTNEGSFTINATDNTVVNIENLNNFNIIFSGQTDNENSKIEHNISINYSENEKFPIIYRQIGNQIGLQTDYVGSKFINIETDKISNLQLEQMSTIQNVVGVITSIVKITNISFSEEELKPYTDILQNISDDKFSNVNDSNGTGYQLTLNGEELKELLIQLLETLKNDQATINKLDEYVKEIRNSASITSNDIDELIRNIENNNEISNENFSIIVYKRNNKVNKIVITLNEIKIDIQKVANSNNNINYNIMIDINYNNENIKLTSTINYEGLEEENAKESCEVILESGAKIYNYKIENNVVFNADVGVEDFTTENSTILTNYDEETVNTFLNAVEQRIIDVNTEQMHNLGISENQNPILHLIPTLNIYNDVINTLSEPEIKAEDVLTFNQKFEVYQSTNLQGVTVRGLLSTIQLNNEQQEENRQIKEINFNGEEYEVNQQNIAAIKEEVVAESYYRVEFERDQETGLIYRTVINPK